MQPKLARHPRQSRKHATHASTLLTQTRHPRKHATHARTNSTPFLKLHCASRDDHWMQHVKEIADTNLLNHIVQRP